MPPNRVSLAEAARSCRKVVLATIDTAKQVRMFTDECKGLSAFARRLQPLLDDLEDNVLSEAALERGVVGLQALEAGVQRALASIGSCVMMGPFYALLNQEAVLAEFINASTDILSALEELDVRAMKVEEMQAESVALLVQQMKRLAVSYLPCAAAAQTLSELRNQMEAVRTGAVPANSIPVAGLQAKFLRDCSVGQLSADVSYLQQQLGSAQQARRHVEAFFLRQLLALELPLLPADSKTTGTQGAHILDRQLSSQMALPPPTAQVDKEAPSLLDPVPAVRELIRKLTTPSNSLEQRAAALQPLVAAAGLDPSGDASSCGLHRGAVLFALTDPECAAQCVALLNEPNTEPLIKGWLLALVLSLVHPEKGLNESTQVALLRSGLPGVLCRLVVSPRTLAEQRLQSLAMLRVMAHDPGTHAAMMDANVLNALVGKIGDVQVIKGKPVSARDGGVYVRHDALSSDEPLTTDQQVVELAVLIVGDMAAGPFKADILSCGGIKALCQCVCDSGPERVRAAAAVALSALLVDGAIAVEAARDGVLVGLVELIRSPLVKDKARYAVQQLLTPTPPTSDGTAAMSRANSNAAVVMPPQGKAAKLATATSGSNYSGSYASSPTSTKRGAAPVAPASPPKSDQEQAVELFEAMGKAFNTASTCALMDLLAIDDATLTPLAISFLPLTAHNPSCRAAIISHTRGLPVLLREAGMKQRAAVDALRRVAADNKLKSQCASVLAQALMSAGFDMRTLANLALTLAEVGDVPPGCERDRSAVAAASAFAGEVVAAGALAPLATLVKGQDPKPKAKGVRALRPLAMYGDNTVKDAIVAADLLLALVDASRMEVPADQGDRPIAQAACDTLAGLAYKDTSQQLIFGVLVGFMSSPAFVPAACNACLAVVKAYPATAAAALQRAGMVPLLVGLLAKGDPSGLSPPARLLAVMAGASVEVAAAAALADACVALPRVLELGDDDARSMAATAAGFIMKSSDKARNQLVDRKGVALIINVVKGGYSVSAVSEEPVSDGPCSALATLCMLHEGSRYEISRALKSSLTRSGSPPAEVAGAAVTCKRLSHSAKGREILFSDGLIDGLIKALGNTGAQDAQRWAADALLHAASAGSVTLTPATGSPALTIQPKPQIINKGAMDALVQMLRSPSEAVIYESAMCIECLVTCPEGISPAKTARTQDALQVVVQAGKRHEVSDRAAKASYAAYMKLL